MLIAAEVLVWSLGTCMEMLPRAAHRAGAQPFVDSMQCVQAPSGGADGGLAHLQLAACMQQGDWRAAQQLLDSSGDIAAPGTPERAELLLLSAEFVAGTPSLCTIVVCVTVGTTTLVRSGTACSLHAQSSIITHFGSSRLDRG